MVNPENPYLHRQKLMQDKCFEIGIDEGMQIMCDLLDIVLNDKKIMGKNVYGKKRLQMLKEQIHQKYTYYAPAWGDGMECDAKQKELDGCLKNIYGEEYNPFSERYPYCKDVDYSKPHRELKKKKAPKGKKKGKKKRK